MKRPGGISVSAFYGSILAAVFTVSGAMGLWASEPAARYEYKLVRLGSLSSLQKDEAAEAKRSEVERTLNEAGLDGWELVNVFAVRTTFDPNVFYAVIKRQISNQAKGDDVP